MANEMPTRRAARRSTCSMRSSSRSPPVSARRRQTRTDPEMVSTKLSTPKAIRAMLPATTPAPTAMRPSTMFQPTVRYSRRRPRARSWGRVRRAGLRHKTAAPDGRADDHRRPDEDDVLDDVLAFEGGREGELRERLAGEEE